jgi:hypothetical protein
MTNHKVKFLCVKCLGFYFTIGLCVALVFMLSFHHRLMFKRFWY